MTGLLTVLIPLCIGYLIKITHPVFLKLCNQFISTLLYIILLLMGISIGQLENLANKLSVIGLSSCVFAFCIQGMNLIALISYDKLFPSPLTESPEKLPSRLHFLKDSIKLCSMVILGFILGYATQDTINLPFGSSTYVLLFLLFFVGVQLRNSGISLQLILFNKRGIQTGLVMTASSLVGGIIAALWLQLPLNQGLAIASGLGWYSLSSVMISNTWGTILGSIAFFNDLSREIICLFIIPLLIRNYRSTAVGYAGATALDCTLPVIQKLGGVKIIPFTISFGFITNIFPPFLLALFTHIAF